MTTHGGTFQRKRQAKPCGVNFDKPIYQFAGTNQWRKSEKWKRSSQPNEKAYRFVIVINADEYIANDSKQQQLAEKVHHEYQGGK